MKSDPVKPGPLKPRPEVVDDVDSVVATRNRLRATARERLGVTGRSDDSAPFREVLRTYGLGLYPLAAICLLGVADTFQSYAFAVLTPEISTALGVGKGAIAAVIALKTLALGIAPLPMAALAQRKARRAALCIVTGLAWSLVGISTGFVTLIWGLMLVLVLDGISSGSVGALHLPLLLDSYPPEARVRSISFLRGAEGVGNVIAPLVVAALATVFGFTWRGVFVVLGLASLVSVLLASRLRDPGFGRWDTDQIRSAVHELHGDTPTVDHDDVTLGFFEIVRRLLFIPTVRRLLISAAVLGVLSIPYQTFLLFFFDERWGLGPGGRGLFFAFTAGSSTIALVLYGRRGEEAFRENPARVLRQSSVALMVGVALICAGSLAPTLWLSVLSFAAAGAAIAVVGPGLSISLLSVIPARMRPHAAALYGITSAGAGGLLGALFLSGIDRRFGVVGTMVSLLVPGVAAAALMATSARFVSDDLDHMIDEILEEEEIDHIRSTGGRLPMLACRSIDFSYGQLQVLFGVNFTVDDGEMVALLGTNGAGKSTLLKVVSGIGLPSMGSVRFRGADITYLDAERRLRLGITQIPGGRAVFGPLTVVDNLRGFAYTIGANKAVVDGALDRCFEAFPRLAERRNQLASTLSGGEQQMLGLSKALILRPRLLLIDELSLGLAPVIVGQLLDMVREINNDGTAVVLVEQSVNIALNLVDHAYFMEKGEMRFDGPSRDLLARDDLLRAVFLEGTAKAATAAKTVRARAPKATR